MDFGFGISDLGFGLVLSAAVAVPAAALGQAEGTYAGQEQREIKALSPQEVHAYRIGEGMGLAKAAETFSFLGHRCDRMVRAVLTRIEREPASRSRPGAAAAARVH